MSTINVNVTKIQKDVTINTTPNVTQIIVTTQSGGGGGTTNLSLTANPTNNVVSNDNGTGFTIPLADGINAGLITASEKTKLAVIEAGAEVNINADWNAISGDAEILNKPTIPSITGLVAKSDYAPAHSLLVQQSGIGSPTSVAIGTNEILGRLSSGSSNIEGLSVAQVKTLLDLSGTNTGDNATNTTSNAYADGKVTDAIVDGVTTVAPSQNAVFDALALKVDKTTTQVILENNFSPNILTSNVTVETIVDSYDLGIGFLGVGESLNLYAELVKNSGTSGTANTFFYLSKVTNSISVTDAVKIATAQGLSSGVGSITCERTFHRKSTAILSGRVTGTTASITDKVSLNNIPLNLINDANLSDYRFLIVASTYSGTGGGLTMQTNIILTKNPVV